LLKPKADFAAFYVHRLGSKSKLCSEAKQEKKRVFGDAHQIHHRVLLIWWGM
jgi:hypothetical protein